jgi:hypothetical protein
MYSASVKAISRSSGRSATAAAAYRIGEKITDHRTGDIHDYKGRYGVEGVSMHLPAELPSMTSEALWNAAEMAETRKNSTVARELLVALPHELTKDGRLALADRIALELVQRYQVGVQLGVHLPDREGDQRNHHVHILFTTRRLGPDGMGEKTRELDDLKQGRKEVRWIRKMVEVCTNTALAEAGLDVRVDCRKLVEQRISALQAGDQALAHTLDRAPTLHEGPRVTQIRRECARKQRAPLGLLDRLAANDAIHTQQALRIELARVEAQIIHLDAERTKRRVKAARLEWLRREAAVIEAAQGTYWDINRQVLKGFDQRIAQVETNAAASAATDPDWLAGLWSEALICGVRTAMVDGPTKRRLIEMLGSPLPTNEADRQQHWLALSAELQRSEAEALESAERAHEAQVYLGPSGASSSPDDMTQWYAVHQKRIDAIVSALAKIEHSRVRAADAQVLASALRNLLDQVQQLTPETLSLPGMVNAADLEGEEFARLPAWIAEQEASLPSFKPSCPRLR